MIENIYKIYRETDFDFRLYAYSDDALSYLFDHWVDYYRMKYAVCKAINPISILEIGVRYGYSAISFLSACPNASYLGIDNDSDSFGGEVGAVSWAKEITKDFDAKYLVADTQVMSSLPGEVYDLIHIDGQQDGDGTFHDLELALGKAKYILVDGFFWTKENMLSSTYFMEKYKDFMEFSIILSGYAGELLIKVKPALYNCFNSKNYKSLKEAYTKQYFLSNCGGFEEYLKTKGERITDLRMMGVFLLCNPQPTQRILDIGCGRGELAFALSLAGANVLGLDYSDSAIEIALQGLKENSRERSTLNLEYICADFVEYSFAGKFDRIIAADFIEHLDMASTEEMLSRVSGLLNNNGMFIVHTSPNKLNYLYEHRRKRKYARSIGSYLPANPRTYYEDLMHLNEQTPAGLHRLLKKYFGHVLTWVSLLPDFAGSLNKESSGVSYFRKATSIFSVASHSNISKDGILSLITQDKLYINKIDVQITTLSDVSTLKKSTIFQLSARVLNKGEQRLASLPPFPVHISYHWMNENGEYEIYDGLRTTIDIPLMPHEEREVQFNVKTPDKAGNYFLNLTLVQERCFWFDDVSGFFPATIRVSITD